MGHQDEYEKHLKDAGYANVITADVSDWYRAEVRREYELMKGELYPRMVALLGQQDADHFVENWRAMVVVCKGRDPARLLSWAAPYLTDCFWPARL